MKMLRSNVFCKHCGQEFLSGSSSQEFTTHLRWCDHKPGRDVFKRASDGKILYDVICDFCGDTFYSRRKTTLSCKRPECLKKSRKMSDETKGILSVKQKTFLSLHPENHTWKRKGKLVSKPCEHLKDYFRSKSIVFVEEWSPLSDRYFSIDIAFPDIKMGIDVNGNQHYNKDGSLKPYYQERHDLIVAAGWNLIELHFSACYNTKVIDAVIDVGVQPDYSEYFKLKADRDDERRRIRETLPRGVKQNLKYAEAQKDRIALVRASDINFSKFGWVDKVSKLTGVIQQKVSKWMEKFVPEIYATAFKKKSRVTASSAGTDII